MITPWDKYLSPQMDEEVLSEYRRSGQIAFQNQREQIGQIFAARRPGSVACLGAGFLNDIPYEMFVKAGAQVHLVDWMAGVTEFGIAHSILSSDAAGDANCIYCQLSNADMYCKQFEGMPAPDLGVCEGFIPGEGPKEGEEKTCAAFEKGELPYLHAQDVTGGYAATFGTSLARALDGVSSWRQAFKRAIALAKRIKSSDQQLNIEASSIDLVLSSMVISQFEHEPYDYFARAAATLLGAPTPEDEARLERAMAELRSLLFEGQLKGHLDEIERILSTNGRCFMAFEFLHNDPDKDRWFLIEQMHKAVGEMGKRFDFDIDSSPQIVTDKIFENASGKSIVYHLLLSPKRG